MMMVILTAEIIEEIHNTLLTSSARDSILLQRFKSRWRIPSNCPLQPILPDLKSGDKSWTICRYPTLHQWSSWMNQIYTSRKEPRGMNCSPSETNTTVNRPNWSANIRSAFNNSDIEFSISSTLPTSAEKRRHAYSKGCPSFLGGDLLLGLRSPLPGL